MYRRSFVIKTYFDLLYKVSDSFSYILFFVWDKYRVSSMEGNTLRESMTCRKGKKERGYCPFLRFGHDREHSVATEFPNLGRDSGFRVATGPAKAGYLRVVT